MPWVRLDDRFPTHRKVAALSNRAFRLHVSALCWTAQQGTAGVVPPYMLRIITSGRNHKKAAEELLDAGLWEALPNGDYQLAFDLFSVERAPNYAPGQRERIYARDGYACVECGVTDDLTLDHIHPRALAGGDGDDNLRTLCRPCNSRKGARI